VTDPELRSRLLGEPVPGEIEAGERSWQVVRVAFAARERKPWLERHSRAVLAVAAAAALAIAAVTPPGRALVERVREVAGVSPSEPALVRLPAPGRLLVESARGPWVVRQDGSKRRLGDYDEASWSSPRGLFVIATSGRRLVALEPDGDIRWTVTQPRRLADARWAPSGFRIAYREEDTLRVVVGDGTGDHVLARSVAAVAPAWRPEEARNVLAYLDQSGTLHVVDVDSREELWEAPFSGDAAQLVWSGDGSRLLVVSPEERSRLYDARGRVVETIDGMTRAAFGPSGTLAYTTFDPATNTSAIVLLDEGQSQRLFKGEGRFDAPTWSPNGRWLLVAWPDADQWLFFRAPSVRGLVAVPNIAREFDPGGKGIPPLTPPFPRVSGWAPAPSD
jgi:dipeptidyl aminopeptidase/acylaminoacyl peptidase